MPLPGQLFPVRGCLRPKPDGSYEFVRTYLYENYADGGKLLTRVNTEYLNAPKEIVVAEDKDGEIYYVIQDRETDERSIFDASTCPA